MALTKITSTNIGANAVTNTAIGYTPANKAGDTFTGDVLVSGTNLKARITDGTNYLTMGQWDTATNRIESSGNRDLLLVAYGSSQQIRLQHASTGDALRINANSHITTPYQPFAHATLGSDQNANNGDVLQFNTAVVNRGNCFNTSTYRFTAPVAGDYLVLVGLRRNTGSTSGYTRATVRINGSGGAVNFRILDPIWNLSSTSYNSTTQDVIFPLSAGDYLDVIDYSSYNGKQYASLECHFMVRLLG